MQITLAVIRLNTSPMAIGRTSLLPFGSAINLDTDKRVVASLGRLPLAIADQAKNRGSRRLLLLSKDFRCSYLHPDGLGPEPLGAAWI